MSGQIFISYRREESRWSARSLHDRLCRNFAPEQIFMDIDDIALGQDFVKVIETTVAKCDVLIAVIGNNWLTSKDDHGDRRLDNREDFVRMEIGTALKREISVIPVLVDGASMPRATDLPEDLKLLARRNALQITDTSFDGDCQRLAAAIRLVLEKAAAVGQERSVATSTPPAQPEADKPSAETLKAVHTLPSKPAEPELVKPPPPSPVGTERKRPSKQIIAFLVIAALLVFAGLIYLAREHRQGADSSLAGSTPTPTTTPSSTPLPTITPSLTPLQQQIENLFSDQAPVRLAAYNVLTQPKFRNDPKTVEALLSFASQHMDNEDGIYNTVVTLKDLSRSVTQPRKDEINRFCDKAEKLGERTKKQSDALRKWLETKS
jgi:hypothetical protein